MCRAAQKILRRTLSLMRAPLRGAGGSNPFARSSFSKILRRTLSLMRAPLRGAGGSNPFASSSFSKILVEPSR
jgi:hypothetical protein